MIKQALSAAIIASATMAPAAMAFEQGDFIIRSGPILVEPNEDSSPITVTNPYLGPVPGSEVGVDNDIQLGLTFSYFVLDQFAIELLAATPFEHDLAGAGSLAAVGKIGSTKHLPPTLSFQYFLNDPDSDIQPYVGIGLNYTIFFEEDTTPILTNSIGTLATLASGGAVPPGAVQATSSDIDIDDSFGLAGQFGIDYRINENWGVNGAVWYIDIEADADITATSNIGIINAEVDVDINPWVYMVGVSYTF